MTENCKNLPPQSQIPGWYVQMSFTAAQCRTQKYPIYNDINCGQINSAAWKIAKMINQLSKGFFVIQRSVRAGQYADEVLFS